MAEGLQSIQFSLYTSASRQLCVRNVVSYTAGWVHHVNYSVINGNVGFMEPTDPTQAVVDAGVGGQRRVALGRQGHQFGR